MSSKIVKNAARKPPAAGKGRPKGALNKTTALLKDAIVQAATNAGNGDLVAYLQAQAIASPGPFLSLLGKVLPMQVTGEGGGAVKHDVQIRIIRAQR